MMDLTSAAQVYVLEKTADNKLSFALLWPWLTRAQAGMLPLLPILQIPPWEGHPSSFPPWSDTLDRAWKDAWVPHRMPRGCKTEYVPPWLSFMTPL